MRLILTNQSAAVCTLLQIYPVCQIHVVCMQWPHTHALPVFSYGKRTSNIKLERGKCGRERD